MAIAEGITAAKAAFEVSRMALDLIRSPDIKAAEVQAKLLELQGLILSSQAALGDAIEENRQLRAENEQLKADRELQTSLIPAEGAYWKRNTDGKLDGPFCTVCWDDARKLIRMVYVHDRQHDQKGLLKVYNCLLHQTMSVKLSAAIFSECKPIS